jgi:hypothetical protein
MSLNHSSSIVDETIPENKELDIIPSNGNSVNGSQSDLHEHYHEFLAHLPHKRVRTLSE